MRHGLEGTAPLWPPIQTAYALVHQAAHVLANHEQRNAAGVQQAYQEVLTQMRDSQASLGPLASALAHFHKVTASYWPGLFPCYDVSGLPRTNNGLEQYFGSARHLERRATGRKGASPALVVRGAVRVVASMAPQLQPFTPAQLQPRDVAAWKALRQRVDRRHATRRLQARFRRAPLAYLTALEDRLLKPVLPP